MADYPTPEPGLVISYSFLWSHEAEQGQSEGRKDRPSVIVLAVFDPDESSRPHVAVAPITHSPPAEEHVAVEIPSRIKAHLGLDDERSWIVLNEFNTFVWPGFDLKPIKSRNGEYEYGLLPPKFFDAVIAKYAELDNQQQVTRTDRGE